MNPRQDTTYKLPDELPPDTVCVQLQIPKGAYYARQFYGAIEQLSYWFAYDSDSARTGKDVAKLWKAALRTITTCPDQQINNPCGCGDDCMCNQLRFHNCVLQQFDCLTQTWIDVPSDDNCVPNPAPGGGTTPPAAGACQDYTIALSANALTIMPFVVNTGDTIQLEAVTGAGTDGTPNWYCADGELYLLGGCAGGGHTNSGDPLPTTNHMALLWKIGSNYYPINSTLFTVPGGVTNAQIWAQVNDSSLADDAGSYNIKFNYCNQQTVTPAAWCRFADMTISPNAGIPSTDPDSNGHHHPLPYWVPGQGWSSDATLISPSTTYENEPRVVFDLGAPTLINFCQMEGVVGASASGNFQLFVIASDTVDYTSGNVTLFSNTGLATGTPYSLGGAHAPVTKRYIVFYSDCYSLPAAVAPVITLSQLTIKGTGTAPSIGVAC